MGEITNRTPDDIERGLECCTDDTVRGCGNCSYLFEKPCTSAMTADALAYIRQLEENLALCEELAESSLKLLNLAVDMLVSFGHGRPCEEMSGGGYCETHCEYSQPQRECWIRYFFDKLGWLDKIPLSESQEVKVDGKNGSD